MASKRTKVRVSFKWASGGRGSTMMVPKAILGAVAGALMEDFRLYCFRFGAEDLSYTDYVEKHGGVPSDLLAASGGMLYQWEQAVKVMSEPK